MLPLTLKKFLSNDQQNIIEEINTKSLVLLYLPEAAVFPSPSPHQLLHLASLNCTKQTLNNVHGVCILPGTITITVCNRHILYNVNAECTVALHFLWYIYLLQINPTRIQTNNKITLKINGNCERKIVEKETAKSADAPYKVYIHAYTCICCSQFYNY